MKITNNHAFRDWLASFFGAASFVCFFLGASVVVSAAEQQGRPEAQAPAPHREVRKDEIKVSRGELEDRLRIAVLAALKDKDQIAQMQAILNSPWDRNSVEYLWDCCMQQTDVSGIKQQTFSPAQVVPILNLLVYVAARHEGCEVGELLKSKFDSFFLFWARQKPVWQRMFAKNIGWAIFQAIGDYGSPSLFGVGFWELVNSDEVRGFSWKTLSKIGDENTLQKLKQIEETSKWPEKDNLAETISAIESRLNAAKKQNETSKP